MKISLKEGKGLSKMVGDLFRRYTRFLPPERRAEVLEQLSQASSPSFDFFVLVFLSTSIATLGLIVDSTAVVIGAMLVAPLMSPILGLSLASVCGEQRMFRRAVVALVRGILLSVALSAVLSYTARALPFDVLNDLPQEVLSRTRPTPFDLGIALAGGMAAAYALAQPHLSAALPGVAIATALVPPLCTVGIGISLGSPAVALGALLLFLTNLVTISFSGILVFAALGFRPLAFVNGEAHIRNHLAVSFLLVFLVTVPLVGLTLNFVGQAHQEEARQALEAQVRDAVGRELARLPNAQLVDVVTDQEGSSLHLLVTVRTVRQFTYREVLDLQESLAGRLQLPIALELIAVPIIRLDPRVPPTWTPTATLGPSPSPTLSLTSTPRPPSPTATASITPTPSPIPATPTVTSTATPTPALAQIAFTGGVGVYLRAEPGGRAVGSLPESSPVLILYRRETVRGAEWIEIQDLLGRTGWVQAQFLSRKP